MNKIGRLIPTLIFNLAETAIIFLSGIALKLDMKYVVILMLTLFAQKMIREVDSPEAKQVIRKHLRKISQMG